MEVEAVIEVVDGEDLHLAEGVLVLEDLIDQKSLMRFVTNAEMTAKFHFVQPRESLSSAAIALKEKVAVSSHLTDLGDLRSVIEEVGEMVVTIRL